MKIGTITLPLHTNYGGILQAYALQKVLEGMGHDAYLIEKKEKPACLRWLRVPPECCRWAVRSITGHPYSISLKLKNEREMPVIRQHTDRFICQHIRRNTVGSFGKIGKTDYDAFVVGSDQIWRTAFFGKHPEHAFLDFTEGWSVRRVAYAASFGTDRWEFSPQLTASCGRLLRRFNGVSVREDAAVTLCREHFGVEARHVLDPTMLLEAGDYTRLFARSSTPKSKGTLLCYILDMTADKQALIDAVGTERGLTPFSVKSKSDDIAAPLAERIQPPLEEWLRGFYDAEFVVTDSFHACAFSILFNKPFIAYGNEGRGMSRFTSLLNMFGLADRLVRSASEARSVGDIDWPEVNALLARHRQASRAFLTEMLGEGK